MAFHFGSKPPAPADTGTRLDQCREHLAAAESELSERQARYESAIERSAGDTTIKTESAEVRREHAALLQARAVADRARDHVVAAEKLHAESVAYEAAAANQAAWDRVDEIAQQRVVIAEEYARAAEVLARCRSQMAKATAALHAAIPTPKRQGPNAAILADWQTPLVVELRRLEILPDRVSRLAPLMPLVEKIRGHRDICAQLRSAA